jgi:hypothetical protein
MAECRYCGRYFVNVGICLYRHEEERSCLSCPDARLGKCDGNRSTK